jgi:hypothetical protein
MRAHVLIAAALGLSLALATSALGQGVPVQPGNATTRDFGSASTCVCHATLSDQWRHSMHAIALSDPVFQLKVAQAEQQAGPAVAIFCKRCHSPIGNMVGDPDGKTSVAAAEGIPCMFCHQAVGDTGAHGNTSQLIVPDLIRRAQIQNPAAPHPALHSAYVASSEICGGCHDMSHPTNGLALDTTYREWAASSYAKDGVTCEDCHMSGTAGVPGPVSGESAVAGPPRKDIFSMSFVGANVGQGPIDASIMMLKSAASTRIDLPSVVAPGSAASVTVTVTNKGAGHDLPTGFDERQMWLTLYTVDSRGARTTLAVRHFGTVFADANGNHPVDLWNAVRVYSVDRIPAHGSVRSTYSFEMPIDAATDKLVATLEYKSLPDDLAAKAQVDNPVTQMASSTKTVFASLLVQQQMEAPGTTTAPAAPKALYSLWMLPAAALALAVMLGIVSIIAVSAQRSDVPGPTSASHSRQT